MQCIWENGASGEAGAIRESHDEILSTTFSHAMIRLLSDFVGKQQNNWVHPLKLLSCTLIAIRIFELNDDKNLADEIVTLFNKIRSIALEWIEKIQMAIRDMPDLNVSTEQALRMKLIFVTVAGALTFGVHSRHKNFSKIFRENEAGFSSPRVWLQFIVVLNNNILLNNCDNTTLPLNLRVLLRLVRSTGIHVEQTLR